MIRIISRVVIQKNENWKITTCNNGNRNDGERKMASCWEKWWMMDKSKIILYLICCMIKIGQGQMQAAGQCQRSQNGAINDDFQFRLWQLLSEVYMMWSNMLGVVIHVPGLVLLTMGPCNMYYDTLLHCLNSMQGVYLHYLLSEECPKD